MVDDWGNQGTQTPTDGEITLYMNAADNRDHFDCPREECQELDEKPVFAPVCKLGSKRSPMHQTPAARAVRTMTRGRR